MSVASERTVPLLRLLVLLLRSWSTAGKLVYGVKLSGAQSLEIGDAVGVPLSTLELFGFRQL